MKILVPLKQTPDPGVAARPLPDGAGVDTTAAPLVINPFDEVALQAALSLREAEHAREVLVVAIGPPSTEQALRTALALGADRALHVATETFPEPLAVARLLATLARREQTRLVLMGKQAIDDDCGCVAPMLAAMLGWPQAMHVVRIDMRDGVMEADCETERGIARLRLEQPCVIGAELRLAEPRFVSLAQKMKVRRAPITRIPASELTEMPPPALRLLRVEEGRGQRHRRMLRGAEELVALLESLPALREEEA